MAFTIWKFLNKLLIFQKRTELVWRRFVTNTVVLCWIRFRPLAHLDHSHQLWQGFVTNSILLGQVPSSRPPRPLPQPANRPSSRHPTGKLRGTPPEILKETVRNQDKVNLGLSQCFGSGSFCPDPDRTFFLSRIRIRTQSRSIKRPKFVITSKNKCTDIGTIFVSSYGTVL